MIRGLILLFFVSFALSGCGSGGEDDSFPTVPPFVTNQTLEGLYNQISVCYTSRSRSDVPKVDARDAEYNLGVILPPPPPICDMGYPLDLVLKSYDFPSGNMGVGALDVARISDPTNTLASVDYMADSQGGMTLFSVPSPSVTTPVLGVQLKAIPSEGGDLTLENFEGHWGLVSMELNGRSVVAELHLTESAQGVPSLTGVGFQSNVSGPLPIPLQQVVNTSTVGNVVNPSSPAYALNPGKDKLLFLGWEWFLNPEVNVAMTDGGLIGVGSDRLAIMVKPGRRMPIRSLEGVYEIFQWSTHSTNLSTTVTTGVRLTDIPASEIMRRGKIEFRGGTAVFENIMGITDQSVPYQIEVGTNFMHSFWVLDNRPEQDVFFRFFMSEDYRYFVGADLANDNITDRRTTMLLGIAQSAKAP